MKETIRCCIACILPCGALDVIRIVHSNGHVEEISGTITANEVMRLHPKHVLKKFSSSSRSDHDFISATKIVHVPPEAELQRGKIYFLMPATKHDGGKIRRVKGEAKDVKKCLESHRNSEDGGENSVKDKSNEKDLTLSISDPDTTEVLSKKVPTQKDRRKGHVGVWRPHLESISED